MTESANKKRGWIKNLTIIFLALALAATLLSNTIMNWSLPEVSAEYARYGELKSSIRVTGTVEAVSTYKVYIEDTRVIESIEVRKGQTVEKGQVLFLLEAGDSVELKEALAALENEKETLRQLETDYEKYLIEQSPAYSDMYQSVQKAWKAYEDALALAGTVASCQTAYDKALSAEKAAQKEVERLQRELNKIGGELEYDDITAQLREARSEYNRLSGELAAAEQQLSQATAMLDGYQSSDGQMDSQLQQLMERQSELESVKGAFRTLDDMWAERQVNIVLLEQLKSALPTPPAAEEETPETADPQLQQQIAALEATVAQQTLQINRNIEDLQIRGYSYTYQASSAAVINDLTRLTAQIATLQSNSSLYSTQKQQAEKYREQAQKAYDETKIAYDQAEARVEMLENSAEAEVLTAELEAAEETLGEKSEVKADAEEKLREAENAAERVEELKETYDALKKSYDKAEKLENYTDTDKKNAIEKQKKAVEAQQAVVDKLAEKENGSYEVISKVSGTVTDIDCYAGETVTRDTVLASIEITDMGYTSQVSVTNEQARRIKVGDSVTVQNNWYGAEAKITGIKTDPSNPRDGKLVTLSVVGGVDVGTQLTFLLGERTTYYQTTVPNSAVYEDNKGKFVLAVEVKASPLGNRYIARRMEVEVVSSDETTSAVEGLMGNEFVITSSTEPVADGKQVRLIEQ